MRFTARPTSRLALSLIALTLATACSSPGVTTPPPPPPEVAVTVSPGTASVSAGASQLLTATVTNSDNTAVTWSATGGTVNGTGASVTWTAPGAGGSYTVTATSVADPARHASATVTVATVGVAVAASTPEFFIGERRALTATVSGAADGQTGVIWSATCGTFATTGNPVQYDAPAGAGTCTVTATSTLDPARSGQTTVTVRSAMRVNATNDIADDAGCSWAHCSLREAITTANLTPGRDSIFFAGDAVGTALRAPAVITLAAALPAITTPIHLVGPGVDLLTIDAAASIANPRRVLDFTTSAVSTVSGMILRGGVTLSPAAPGGGGGVRIAAGADVSLTDVNIVANEARGGDGGGLQLGNASTARLVRVNVDNNKTFGGGIGGGGIVSYPASTLIISGGRIKANSVENAWGGGLYVTSGSLTMTGTTVEGNSQTNTIRGGGGILIDGTSTATITGATISGNSSYIGGGIYLINTPTVAISGTTISGNTALSDGAGVYIIASPTVTITGTTISNNTGGNAGGGVLNFGTGPLTITDSRVTGNSSTGQGGGLHLVSGATVILRRVTVSGNTTRQGGGGITAGGVGANLLIENSTISGNSVTGVSGTGIGGGLWIADGTHTLRNVTISGNSAATQGGGIMAYSPVTLYNTTLVANTSVTGGGGIIAVSGTAGLLGRPTLFNTLFSGNLNNGSPQNCLTTGGGTFVSSGGNLSSDATCTVLVQPTDKNNQSAGISATLADNGGTTLTHALQTGSVAINAGVVANCSTTDQRNFTRQGNCDIGAFEFGGVSAGAFMAPSAMRIGARPAAAATVTSPPATVNGLPVPITKPSSN